MNQYIFDTQKLNLLNNHNIFSDDSTKSFRTNVNKNNLFYMYLSFVGTCIKQQWHIL